MFFSDDFQPVLAMKLLVESKFQGQGPPKPPEPPEPPVPPEPPEWVLVVTGPGWFWGGSGVVLARKFLVESEFQGQEPQKPAKIPEPPVLSGSPEWVLVLTVPI